MATQKISFRVPPGLWEKFAAQASELFLNRAPFLNYAIGREVPELVRDLGGRRLSVAAKRYISGQLKKQGPKSVNIEIEEATAAALNVAVRQGNLVRDAFLCRLLIFLRSTDTLLAHLEVPRDVRDRSAIGLEPMPSSPMKAMEVVRDDPLFYVRHHVEHNWNCGIYLVQLPRALDWASCFLEDKDVRGTRAFKEEQRISAELYDAMERDAFVNAPAPEKMGVRK